MPTRESSQKSLNILLLSNESLGIKLSELGYRNTSCSNFFETISRLNTQNFDVLILEYNILKEESKEFIYLMYLLKINIQIIWILESCDIELPIVLKGFGNCYCINKPYKVQEITTKLATMRKILLITENNLFAEGLKSLLRNNSFICYEATDENFLLIKRKCLIDTIVTDNINILHSLNKDSGNVLVLLNDTSLNIDIFKLIKQKYVNAIIPINTSIKEISNAIDLVSQGEKYYSTCFTKAIIDFYSEEHNLNQQEYKILICIAKQMTNLEISKELFLSPTTVKTYISKIIRKLSLKNRFDLNIYALKKYG